MDNLGFDAQHIAGAHRVWPPQFVDAQTNHALSKIQRLHEEPHGHRRRMPAARNQSFENRPLGRGFLSGTIQKPEDLPKDDYRRTTPRFQGENFQRNLDLVHRVSEIAREKRCTAAQLALAWVLAQGQDIVPIPGTKRRKYLQENIGALDVDLTSEDLARIDEVAPKDAFAGSRYPEAMMKLLAKS